MNDNDGTFEMIWMIVVVFGIGTMVYHLNLILGLLEIIAKKG